MKTFSWAFYFVKTDTYEARGMANCLKANYVSCAAGNDRTLNAQHLLDFQKTIQSQVSGGIWRSTCYSVFITAALVRNTLLFPNSALPAICSRRKKRDCNCTLYYNGRHAMPKEEKKKKRQGRPDYCFTH